jgi:drug/metabolite transporter (DMT)-like permease
LVKFKNFLLLLLLAALWGPSFLFIKVGVAEIRPLTFVLGRVGIAALVLYGILRWQGGRLPGWGAVWKHIAVVALLHNSLPFVLFSWGELYIDSALASILNGTTPLFTIVLAHFLTDDDHLSPAKVGGVVLGLSGLAFLIGPTLFGGFEVTTWGLLAVVVASICYGIAIVYVRNYLRGLPPLVAPTMQMMLASLYLVPLVLWLDRPLGMSLPSLPALGSWLALGVLGTALAFIVYYRLIETADASYVSMVTYIVPVFGVLLGVLVLHERLSWNTYLGFGLILLGVMAVNGVFRGRGLGGRRRWQAEFGD